MAAPLTADVVLFAMNAALKLGGNLRKAYAESVRGKTITLPLPDVDLEPNETTIEYFFEEEGKVFLGKIAHLDQLHETAHTGSFFSDPEELKAYRNYYYHCWNSLHGKNQSLSSDETINLFQIRQWEQGQAPRTNVLQLVAGSIVDIGIAYFRDVPGALSKESAHGQALHHFLMAMGDISFSESEDLKNVISQSLIPRLFAGVAEAISGWSPDISGDPKLQLIIYAAGKGLSEDIYQRVAAAGTFTDKEKTVSWAQLVIRSLVKNTGQLVVDSPDLLFGSKEQLSLLISDTGKVILETLLDDDKLEPFFSLKTLDDTVKAALAVVQQHPELISEKKGVKQIISGVSGVFAEGGIRQEALLPEFIRIVLEKSAGNLELLWPGEEEDPARHLLIRASRDILQVLTKKPVQGKWSPKFSDIHLKQLSEMLLDEVLEHPWWVSSHIDDRSVFHEILQSVLQALETLPENRRLRQNTLGLIFQFSLKSLSRGQALLVKKRWFDSDAAECTLLQRALMVCLHAAPADQGAGLVNETVLRDMLNLAFEYALEEKPNNEGLALLKIMVDPEIRKNSGMKFEPWKHNRDIYNAVQEFIQNQPDLALQENFFPGLIQDFKAVVQKLPQGNDESLKTLLPLLIKSLGQDTALFVKTDGVRPTITLIKGLGEVVDAIVAQKELTSWWPGHSPKKVYDYFNFLIDYDFIDSPQLLEENQNVYHRQLAFFRSIEKINPAMRPKNSTVEDLYRESVSVTKKVLWILSSVTLSDGKKYDTALEYLLSSYFSIIYGKKEAGLRKFLEQAGEPSLFDHYLRGIEKCSGKAAEQEKLVARFQSIINEVLSGEDIDYFEVLDSVADPFENF